MSFKLEQLVIELKQSVETLIQTVEMQQLRIDHLSSVAASVKHGNTVYALIELSRGVPIYGHYGHYGILRVTMEILWEHYAGLHSTAHGNYYI